MRKALIALIVCGVMMSAFAMTSVASAADAGKSNVRQYDVKYQVPDPKHPGSWVWIVWGKMTVKVLDDGSGTYVLDANLARLHIGQKDYIRGLAGMTLDMKSPVIIPNVGTVNEGGILHGQGTLDKATVDKLALVGDKDILWFFA